MKKLLLLPLLFLAIECCPCKKSTAATVGGPVAPGGAEVQIDLPQQFHLRNRGGSDGAGLCVFASLKHAAVWQDVDALTNIFEWMFRHPGGGYPDKVDRVIAQICKEKNVPVPPYLQVQGKDLEILKKALASGRMPCVTYSYSPTHRYGGRIAHMVNILHGEGDLWCVLDNNFPKTYEWMDTREFSHSYLAGGSGWAVIFLDNGPPPIPEN